MTFADTADAVAASTEMIDSKMGKSLKRFLTKNVVKKELKDKVGRMASILFVLYQHRREMTDSVLRVDKIKMKIPENRNCYLIG